MLVTADHGSKNENTKNCLGILIFTCKEYYHLTLEDRFSYELAATISIYTSGKYTAKAQVKIRGRL